MIPIGNGIPHPSNNLISNDNTDKQTMKKLHRLASTQRDHILLQDQIIGGVGDPITSFNLPNDCAIPIQE
jgi:hypothetical protein